MPLLFFLFLAYSSNCINAAMVKQSAAATVPETTSKKFSLTQKIVLTQAKNPTIIARVTTLKNNITEEYVECHAGFQIQLQQNSSTILDICRTGGPLWTFACPPNDSTCMQQILNKALKRFLDKNPEEPLTKSDFKQQNQVFNFNRTELPDEPTSPVASPKNQKNSTKKCVVQ